VGFGRLLSSGEKRAVVCRPKHRGGAGDPEHARDDARHHSHLGAFARTHRGRERHLASSVQVALCDGKCVDALVQLDAGMAFDEHPFDFVPVGFHEQLLPELTVLDRLLRGGAPAVRLPRVQPAFREGMLT